MKKIITILVALLGVNAAFAQWTSLNPVPQNNLLSSVRFSDANTGFAVGDSGVILKTNNAGLTWTTLISGTTNNLSSVYFIDSTTGFVAGSSGTILKTTDGGITWINLPGGTTNYLRSVYFTDANHGLALGDNLTIVRTTDGGTTWTDLSLSGEGSLNSVCFADANRGYAVGMEPNGMGIVLRTDDGGGSWGYLSMITGPLFSVYCTDANTAYATGGNLWYRPPFSEILKITDGGANWSIQGSENYACLNSVFFPDPNTGYAVGDFGFILKTSDAGSTWTIQNSGITTELTSVFFTNPNTGYAVGGDFYIHKNCTILKTTNGGNLLGVDNYPATSNALKIYPNPSSDEISIEIPTSMHKSELSIWNMNGQLILTSQINDILTKINISTLPGGVYEVKVVGENGVQVGKFLKQ